MKQIQNSLLFTTTLLSTAIAQSVNAEVPIRDYTEATSAYESAIVNLEVNANNGNQAQTSFNADVEVDYGRVISSPDANTTVRFNGTTSSRRGGSRSDDSTADPYTRGKVVSDYMVAGSLIYDSYVNPQESDFFWYGSGAVEDKKNSKSAKTIVSAGVGYGRVVNATPMATTNRLISSLLERGLLSAPPSAAVYHKIARIVARKDEYKTKYGSEDYKQQWIFDVEKAMGVELDARGIIKVYDVLEFESITTRKYGWLVRAGAAWIVKDTDGEEGKPGFELAAEYHNPISNSAQFSNVAAFSIRKSSSDTDAEDVFVGNDIREFSNLMSYTLELTDRVEWVNEWSYRYLDNSQDSILDTSTHSLSSAYRFYISNVITMDVVLKATKQDYDLPLQTPATLEEYPFANDDRDVDTSLSVSIRYRLK